MLASSHPPLMHLGLELSIYVTQFEMTNKLYGQGKVSHCYLSSGHAHYNQQFTIYISFNEAM